MTASPKQKKWWKRIAVIGTVIGLTCNLLPPNYKGPCEVVAKVCTLGVSP